MSQTGLAPWETLRVDGQSGVPMWLQLKTQMEYAIATGAVPTGTRLPSVRALALRLGVAVDTVRQSYDALAQAGLVATQHGVGTFTTLPDDAQPDAATASKSWSSVDMTLAELVRSGCDLQIAAKAAAHRLALLHHGFDIVFVGVGFSAQRYASAIGDALPGDMGEIRPIDIGELRGGTADAKLDRATYAISLVFHSREVEQLLASRPIRVLSVMSRLQHGIVPQAKAAQPTRRETALLVSRPETRPIYQQLLREQDPGLSDILFASDTDEAALSTAMAEVDLVLHTSAAKAVVEKHATPSHQCVELRHVPLEKSVHRLVQTLRADSELLLDLQRLFLSRPGAQL